MEEISRGNTVTVVYVDPSVEVEVRDSVVVHVDPSCPFAWITSRWLAEVERLGDIDLEVRLLSLAVVNEHRELDSWYREFNDRAWGPARVMNAVDGAHGAAAARQFYEAFGERFHVQLETADCADRDAVAADALADAGLPDDLIAASRDSQWDDELRTVAHRAIAAVGLDVGVPLTEIDGIVAAGPVLSAIPRNQDALDLYRAARVLTRQPGFIRVERQRVGALHVT